jgi:hypothetical protein
MIENSRSPSLLHQPLKVINVGLELFYESLVVQGTEVVQVGWTPPAGGDQEIAELLEKLLE